jgi:hypothetical protein
MKYFVLLAATAIAFATPLAAQPAAAAAEPVTVIHLSAAEPRMVWAEAVPARTVVSASRIVILRCMIVLR